MKEQCRDFIKKTSLGAGELAVAGVTDCAPAQNGAWPSFRGLSLYDQKFFTQSSTAIDKPLD